MKIALAKAYNGLHKKYSMELKKLGHKTCYFDIDSASWLNNILKTKADLYIWHADDKEKDYRKILDKVYFIEKHLRKKIFPDYNMYYSFNDKIKQYDILNYYKFPTIKTFITYKEAAARTIIKQIKYPFILKDPHGFSGRKVFKISNHQQAKSIVKKIFSPRGYKGIKNQLFAQNFVPNLKKDLRIVTIGNKIAIAQWRIGPANSWKHNVGLGAKIDPTNIPGEVLKACIQVSKKLKYHWMAYDVFYIKKNKFFINEFSCNFGAAGPKRLGIDIRKMQMIYLNTLLKK